MQHRRFLLGFVALASLGLGQSAQAAFSVTTSTTGYSVSTGTLSTIALGAGSTFVVGGQTITVGTAGGTELIDSAGSMIYLLNDSRTAGTTSIPNEQIFVVNTTSGATDTATINFITNINVTNGGVTGTFTEGPNSIAMLLDTNGDANYTVTAGNLAPPTMSIGGAVFTVSNPQASSGDINSPNNGSVSAKVSTPATVPRARLGGHARPRPRRRRGPGPPSADRPLIRILRESRVRSRSEI